MPSATGHQFAILAILCTLAIFFFPLVSGPYPVTHGPATDFETVRACQSIVLIIALAALGMLARVAVYFALIVSGSMEIVPRLGLFLPATQMSILRC